MKINFKKLIIIILITFLIGGIFGFFTMKDASVYKSLMKPFDVPGVIFPIVWSVLYLLMSISYYIISQSSIKDTKGAKTAYFVQLLINSLWTLIFFGFKLYFVSFLWILLLIVAVIIMMIKFYKINKTASLLQIPYLLWLLFAGYLNFMIFYLNK